MFFKSDNWAGASDVVSNALATAHTGYAATYGDSDYDHQVKRQLEEIFETELELFFVSTGTAANALSLTSMMRPGGVVFCHDESHIMADECGAVEYFSGGGRLCPISGASGKINATQVADAQQRYPASFIHAGQPAAISVAQATEAGTIYPLDELDELGQLANRDGLGFHMDGARFANALCHLNVTPAEMTWKRGVDILSFGATKNGCWCAEAVIIFNMELANQFAFLHKRAGQLLSKSQFVAAQFAAYLKDDHWLYLANHTNSMAHYLRTNIEQAENIRHAWPTQSNEIFVLISNDRLAAVRNAGAQFYDWPVPKVPPYEEGENETLCRLVTSFRTNRAEIDQFLGYIG